MEKSSVSRGGNHKAIHCLKENIYAFIEQAGFENVVFLTITFKGSSPTSKQLTVIFNNLLSRYIRPRYGAQGFGDVLQGARAWVGWIRIFERGSKKGRLHYHLLLDVKQDVRSGVDVDSAASASVGGQNRALDQERKFWRKVCKVGEFKAKYRMRLGVVNVLPLRTDAQKVAGYLGKYLTKHFESRKADDKGLRLVGYSREFNRRCGSRFAWNGPTAQNFRFKLQLFCEAMGFGSDYSRATEDLKAFFGAKWGWRVNKMFESIRLVDFTGEYEYPTMENAQADGFCTTRKEEINGPIIVQKHRGARYRAKRIETLQGVGIRSSKSLDQCRDSFELLMRTRLGDGHASHRSVYRLGRRAFGDFGAQGMARRHAELYQRVESIENTLRNIARRKKGAVLNNVFAQGFGDDPLVNRRSGPGVNEKLGFELDM